MRLERNQEMRAKKDLFSGSTKSRGRRRNHRPSRRVLQVIELLLTENPLQLKKLMQEVERGIILRILEKTGGNQRHAAKVLGLKYTTLNEKVKRYKIRFQKKPIDIMVF
ncbi:MAG: helix-turn-helix domain-containing protein [Candidatus Aminicenantales bacterium]